MANKLIRRLRLASLLVASTLVVSACTGNEAPGQAGVVSDFCPGITAVGRLVEATVGATAGEIPEAAPRLPDGRVQETWIMRIER